jgi:hypothetical protein
VNYLISILTSTSTTPQYNTGLYSESVASQGIMLKWFYDIFTGAATGAACCGSFMKWFYDTFTGAATGAARCGSFIGEGFGLLVANYG